MKSSISSGFRHRLEPSCCTGSRVLEEPRLEGAVLAEISERPDRLELTDTVSDLSPVAVSVLLLLVPPVACGVRLPLGVWKLLFVGVLESWPPSSLVGGSERLPENSVSFVFLLIKMGSLGSGVCIDGWR